MLALGASEQNIAKQAMRAGEPLPARIANAPTLHYGLGYFLQAFFDLDGERSQAWGPRRIPWTSVQRYAEAHGLDEEATDELHFMVEYMDGEHLKRVEAKQKAKKK